MANIFNSSNKLNKHITELTNSTNSTDSINSTNSTDSINSTNSTDSINSTNTTDSTDSTDSIELNKLNLFDANKFLEQDLIKIITPVNTTNIVENELNITQLSEQVFDQESDQTSTQTSTQSSTQTSDNIIDEASILNIIRIELESVPKRKVLIFSEKIKNNNKV